MCIRDRLFSLQLVCVSDVDKSLTPSSVMLLRLRFKLFSLQLVCVSAADKCLIPSVPSTVMMLQLRFKLFSLQLVCVSAVRLNILSLHQLSDGKSEVLIFLVHQTDCVRC